MMTKEEIQKGESDRVEFKLTSPSEDHKWLKTVVAFCNGDGGTIVFGVKNSSCAINLMKIKMFL
jgi:predicted HTH transcriptional regulator